MNDDLNSPAPMVLRPPVLLDVTLRDGGYVNGHSWTLDEASAIVHSMETAGVPFTEVGYLRAATGSPLCPSARCEEGYLQALAARVGRTRLVVMVRPGETPLGRLEGLAGLGVGMVRILVSKLDVAPAVPYIEAARAEGLAIAVNLTHASRSGPAELAAAVRKAADAGAGIIYLADSNGSLRPDDVAVRIRAAVAAAEECPAGSVVVGFHPHDNLGLAFANTCAALDAGAGAVDASLEGIGKGGGNLRLELIAAHLMMHSDADFSVDALVRDRSTHAAKFRMLADGGVGTLVTGLLDVSLDQLPEFRERAAAHGYDDMLRGGGVSRPPAESGELGRTVALDSP